MLEWRPGRNLISQYYSRRPHRDPQKFFSPYKQVNGWNCDHEWLKMTNAFILCDLLWKVQKIHAANREGRFKVEYHANAKYENPYQNSEKIAHIGHIWRWCGTSTLLTPIFDIFRSHWVPFLCPTRSYWHLFLQKKICLSLSHFVTEIIWPKVGLFFTKTNLSFDTFKAICTTFLLDFRSCSPPFCIGIRYCWLLIFTKL